jgi:hypothetical protein
MSNFTVAPSIGCCVSLLITFPEIPVRWAMPLIDKDKDNMDKKKHFETVFTRMGIV